MKKTPAAVTLRLPSEAMKGIRMGLAQAGQPLVDEGAGFRIGGLLVQPASETPVSVDELKILDREGMSVSVRTQ